MGSCQSEPASHWLGAEGGLSLLGGRGCKPWRRYGGADWAPRGAAGGDWFAERAPRDGGGVEWGRAGIGWRRER